MTIHQLVEGHVLAGVAIDDAQTTGLFPRSDWAYEVDNGDTSAGYAAWLESKIEMEADSVNDAIEMILHAAPRVFLGDGDPETYANAVLDAYNCLRALDDEAAERARSVLGMDPENFIFGEICRNLPDDALNDIGAIAHLGMVAFEGRCDQVKLDTAIHQFSQKYNIESDAITAARKRQGIETSHDLSGPEI